MTHYAVVKFEAIHSTDWVREYIQNVTPMVQQVGGEFLARTQQIEQLEGDREKAVFFTLIAFPSEEAAMRFYNSEAYAPYLKQRTEGTKADLFMFPGEDVYAR